MWAMKVWRQVDMQAMMACYQNEREVVGEAVHLLLFAAPVGDRTFLLRWLAVYIHSYRRKYCSSHWTCHISDNI
jgi:hypothetical protein